MHAYNPTYSEGGDRRILGQRQPRKMLVRPCLKNKPIMLFADKWTELERVILSEIGQAQKARGRMLLFICVK
jgi:hypothetical protein